MNFEIQTVPGTLGQNESNSQRYVTCTLLFLARLSNCLENLETLWKHCNCSVSFKLQVWTAVLRAKLLYGFESAQLNQSILDKLDAF